MAGYRILLLWVEGDGEKSGNVPESVPPRQGVKKKVRARRQNFHEKLYRREPLHSSPCIHILWVQEQHMPLASATRGGESTASDFQSRREPQSLVFNESVSMLSSEEGD